MSGRYQSKLFNFLSRQSLQLRHQSAKTWRQAKVAAVWSVQILLYPVYVTFQSARLLNRQIQQAARQVIPRLRSAARALTAAKLPPADAPIQNLLHSLSQLAVHLPGEAPPDLALALAHSAKQPRRTRSAEVLVATAGLTASLQVRGVASMLGTGGLVLVTAENQILDILTAVQQAYLTRRMAWELADYWRQQRRFGQLSQPHAQPLSTYLPLPRSQQNALPPIRAWRELMAWMQRSAVAVSANLFHESRLSLPQALSSQPELSQPELRSAQPAWETAAQFYGWLAQARRKATSLLTPAAKSPLLQPKPLAPADWLMTLDRWVSEIPGLRASPIEAERRSAVQPAPFVNGLNAGWLNAGWLERSLHSLLNRSLIHQQTEAVAWEVTDTAAIETSLKGQTQLAMDQLQMGTGGWDDDYRGRPLRRRQVAGVPLTSLDTANAEEAAMVPQSWIETEAQLVEYMKHPLEQVLEWLDQGMLWVEQRLSKMWQWLTRPIS